MHRHNNKPHLEMKQTNVLSTAIQIATLLAIAFASILFNSAEASDSGIGIYDKNPFYWTYDGEPFLPLGATDDDNLFQMPDVAEHLDALVEAQGNYVRNTMSSRPDGGFEVRAHRRLANGKYDLDQWNPEFWRRFQSFLSETAERDVIVQIELWAFHDLFNTERHPGEWTNNPWNPDANVNYSVQNTTLKSNYDNNRERHDFFYTVPKLDHDPVVLSYQKAFVDKVLSYTLPHDHVLYCTTNEIHDHFSPEWGWYWAAYLKERANEEGKRIHVTEMFQQKRFDHVQHLASFDHPGIYDFVETSQNSGWQDEENWSNLQYGRKLVSRHPRPMNAVKIYGANYGKPWGGDSNDGVERFWRNIVGGCATSRFHRPPTGIGLSERAEANLRSMRMFTEYIVPWEAEPRPDLISTQYPDYAYLLSKPGSFYGIYFPNGRGADLDLTDAPGTYSLKWLKIETSEWYGGDTIRGGAVRRVQTPHSSGWAAVIVRE